MTSAKYTAYTYYLVCGFLKTEVGLITESNLLYSQQN